MNEQEAKVVIDELFGVLESHESGLALKITQTVHAAVDQAIDRYLPQIVQRVNRRLGGGPSPE